MFLDAGLSAERTGKIVGYPGDVEVHIHSGSFTSLSNTYGDNLQRKRIECKRRARAWKDLYDWLDKNETDFLAIRTDYKKALAVMPMATLIEMLSELNARRRQT
jgi:hypothetical protein